MIGEVIESSANLIVWSTQQSSQANWPFIIVLKDMISTLVNSLVKFLEDGVIFTGLMLLLVKECY